MNSMNFFVSGLIVVTTVQSGVSSVSDDGEDNGDELKKSSCCSAGTQCVGLYSLKE